MAKRLFICGVFWDLQRAIKAHSSIVICGNLKVNAMATPKQVESICLLVSLKMLQLQLKRYVNIAKPQHAHKRELGVLSGVLDSIVSDMQGGSKASPELREQIESGTGLSVAAATTYMRFCAVVGDTQNELLGTVCAEIDSTLNECLTPEILQLLQL